MPDNHQIRMDVRVRLNENDLNSLFQSSINMKKEIIHQIYIDASNLYKELVHDVLPSTIVDKNTMFRYRTNMDTLQVTIGILRGVADNTSYDFLRFWLYGTKLHGISFLRHPDIASWALSRGLILLENGIYINNSTGKQVRGMAVKTESHQYIFNSIKNKVIDYIYDRLMNEVYTK